MPLRPYILLTLMFLLALLPAMPASASSKGAVSGSALYGMGNHRTEIDGEEAQSLSSQYLKMDVRYQKTGLLGDKRLGNYTLMLGYEFTTLTPRVANLGIEDPNVERLVSQKPLYQASILLAPGGLPFRLSAYARDLHQTALAKGSYSSSLRGSGGEGFYNPIFFTGVDNGTHREVGATLLLGIRNGSYLGLYRDVLSQVPRLLIDYKQLEVSDLTRDFNMSHYRLRDVAFVSINKKDNWVHFRMRDYTDFLNAKMNSTYSQVLIGTIDQNMDRKWINLTNWLRISGDISYNVEDNSDELFATRTYLLNMMGAGRYAGMSLSILPAFSRATDGNSVDLDSQLPISFSAALNRDTLLRSRLIYQAREGSLYESRQSSVDRRSDFETSTRDYYLDTSLDLGRSRRLTVRPRIELESRRDVRVGDGLALRVSSELLSNKQQRSTLSWLGGYALTTLKTTSIGSEESNIYLQHEIYGRVDKDLSRSLRVGANGSLVTGSGKGRNALSFRIPVMSNSLQVGTGSGGTITNNEQRITSGLLSLYLDHNYRKIDNYLTMDFNFLLASKTVTQKSLRHRFQYTEAQHRLKWESTLDVGDNSGAPETVKGEYLSTNTASSDDAISWYTAATYDYTPGRNTSFTLSTAISGADVINYKIFEKISYRIFTTNGIIRRLAEFSEEIGYEEAGMNSESAASTSYGRFAVAYFPTRYLYGKIRTEINTFRESDSALQQLSGAEVGMDFDKLQFMASYNEGHRDRLSADRPEVVERFWDFKVKKIF